MHRKTLMITGLCALAVALAQAGLRPASAHATSKAALTTTTIRVSTHNARFVLSSRSAPLGVVIFKISNPSRLPHNFSINGRTSKLIYRGQHTTLRVTFTRKGHYTYKDSFDHHASFGEKGGFTIT
jgi:plastocyanin